MAKLNLPPVRKYKSPFICKLYIPHGAALVTEEVDPLNGCKGCYLENTKCGNIACIPGEREDGKHIILKLVMEATNE